ncbi:hypothetical protein THAOC_14963 [Thalassiosira oceanica]|uniref:Uncharacterized protein n=1 Tax=Thalassiosira oceanica TaxID=159749 RepID=K0T1J3_THAOC|nr:hypothetical protein THAOC_14963 [Thalassiosira oceanica]|eukprot:EJK64317.1 hypothetical protein THAOC_14963 [Thalassiosira oceanica]
MQQSTWSSIRGNLLADSRQSNQLAARQSTEWSSAVRVEEEQAAREPDAAKHERICTEAETKDEGQAARDEHLDCKLGRNESKSSDSIKIDWRLWIRIRSSPRESNESASGPKKKSGLNIRFKGRKSGQETRVRTPQSRDI